MIPHFNESDFDSVNESMLEPTTNDKLINDISINNELQETKNNYVSFSSNRIMSQYITPKDDYKQSMMVNQ
jgi:hypothetical protein